MYYRSTCVPQPNVLLDIIGSTTEIDLRRSHFQYWFDWLCVTTMNYNAPGSLREMLTHLYKHWLLTIRVDVPDHLPEDSVRQALGRLDEVHKAASQIVLQDIQHAQHMMRCCLKEVQHLVPANIP